MDRYTDILHRCIKRDRRAQMEFYTLFCRGVYNSCFRILNNPMDAEEVMQETFIKFLITYRIMFCLIRFGAETPSDGDKRIH